MKPFFKFVLVTLTILLSPVASRATTTSYEKLDAAKALQDQVTRMGRDPVFKKEMRRVNDSFAQSAKEIGKLSPGDLKQLDAELVDFIAKTKKNQKVASKSALLRQVLPVQEEVEATIENIKTLVKRYPQVNTNAGVNDAYYTSHGMDYTFHDIDPNHCDKVDCSCLEECEAKFRRLRNEAGLKWWVKSLGGLLNPITLAIESAELAREMKRLAEREMDCTAKCLGKTTLDECRSNKDCPGGQWCREGKINLCSLKLIEGQNCGASFECKTGCCKYNLWANPFHKVCRPTSKCN